MRIPIFVLAAVAGAVGIAQAQVVPDALDAIIDNSQKLQTSVTLDRSVYFPGEAAVVTITVANPTVAALQVFTPFLSSTGCLEFHTLQELPGSSDPVCDSLVNENTPTTIMGAGEQKQITVHPEDGVPTRAGSYALIYSYFNANDVRFQVVSPHLEAAAAVRVADTADTETSDNGTRDIQTPSYQHVLALRWEGQTFICVATPSGDSPDTPDANGDLDDAPGMLTRVATTRNPVVAIAVTADAPGNLTIRWQESDGLVETITYPGRAMPASTPVGVTTVPAGLSVSVDGARYTTPHTFQWAPGTIHSVAASLPEIDPRGKQYVWTGWSDDLEAAHEIHTPAEPTTYTASFDAAEELTLAVSPANSGFIRPMETKHAPGANLGLYPPGSAVKLTADSRSGYTFVGWTGRVADPASAETSVVMNGPQTVTAIFTANVAEPEFIPPAGTYITPPKVMIIEGTRGASIRYTMDGSAPTQTSGTLYSGPITLPGIGIYTLKAIAYANGMTDSKVTTASITIQELAGVPYFTPGPGAYSEAQTVALISSTARASIRYTIDGSTPSPSVGTLYTGPISVPSTTTIRAIAFGSGMATSGVNSATYTIGK